LLLSYTVEFVVNIYTVIVVVSPSIDIPHLNWHCSFPSTVEPRTSKTIPSRWRFDFQAVRLSSLTSPFEIMRINPFQTPTYNILSAYFKRSYW
jgi:hypothetical protein